MLMRDWPSLVFHTARWAIVCWVIVLWRLDYVPLISDEAHYAQLTREMLAKSSWLVPTLDGAPFIDKPILFHWFQALAFQVFGPTELAARLPSAVAAILLFLVTRSFGRSVLGSDVGERGWLMLATVPATFVLSSVGYLDMLFTLFVFGAFACLVTAGANARPRLQYFGYAALVMAVMTKGPVAIALVGLCLATAWCIDAQCRAAIRVLNWPVGLCLVILGSSPWFVWMDGRFGDQFVKDYFLLGHAQYLAPRASGSSADHGFYVKMFLTSFFPWSLVVAGYVIDILRRRKSPITPAVAEKFLWIWIGSVLALFTAASFRVDRYIFPAAPACCLLAARAWLAARAEVDGRHFVATRCGVFLAALILLVVGAALAARLPELGLDVPAYGYLLPLLLCVCGLWIVLDMLLHQFRPPKVTSAPIVGLVATYGLIVAVGFPLFEGARPTRRVGEWLRSQLEDNQTIGVYALDGWQPALRYYGSRPVQRLGSEADVSAFLANGEDRWIVMRRDEFDRLVPPGSPMTIAFEVPAVVATVGAGIRRQVWGDVVVAHRSAKISSSEIVAP